MSFYKIRKQDSPSLNRANSAPGYFYGDTEDSPRYYGVYLGIVKNTQDIQHMGRLQVYMPDWGGDEDNKNVWRTVSYCAPFGGSSPAQERHWEKGIAEYDYTPTSYGFWAVPPDVGNKVLVMFINGDESKGIWIGVLYDNFMNFNVPGLAAYDKHNGPDQVHLWQNVTEYNKFDKGINDPHVPPLRPWHKRQYERMSQTALHEDPYRGWTTSSARREAPSNVYGMSTPGPIDPLAAGVGETFKRSGGHTFVMDDGDIEGNNRLIRLRARGGAQIVIHDTLGFVYMNNKMGTAWLELDKDGNVEIFSNNSISLRSNEDINLRSDRDFNLDIGRDMNIYMPNDYIPNLEKAVQTDLDKNFEYVKVAGLKSPVPDGSIVLHVKEGEVHTFIETGDAYHTMGAGDFNHLLQNGSYYRTIDSGVFEGITQSHHYQKVNDGYLMHSTSLATIMSDSILSTEGKVGAQHASGGEMHIQAAASIYEGAGIDIHLTASALIAGDAAFIAWNNGVAVPPTVNINTSNVFAAPPAELPLLQPFEDMVAYDPMAGPETMTVERRLTRYPTMEPYGGLRGKPGMGTLYHIDEKTTGFFPGIVAQPIPNEEPPVVENEPLKAGSVLPVDTSVKRVDPLAPNPHLGENKLPEPVYGTPTPEQKEGQYAGIGYDAFGNPLYVNVAEVNPSVPATIAKISGKGMDIIKRFTGFAPTIEVNDFNIEYIGYAHKIDKTPVQQSLPVDTTAQATKIQLRSVSGLPPFGYGNIGSETISWSGLSEKNELTGVLRGLGKTRAQEHKSGAVLKFAGEDYSRGITRTQANVLLSVEVEKAIKAVNRYVKKNINQNQADALVSLAHSLGTQMFATSTVVNAINTGYFAKATTEFMRYNHVRKDVVSYKAGSLVKTSEIVEEGSLTSRRLAEAKLFSTPPTVGYRNAVAKVIQERS